MHPQKIPLWGIFCGCRCVDFHTQTLLAFIICFLFLCPVAKEGRDGYSEIRVI